MRTRLALVCVGVIAGGYGAVLLLLEGFDNLVATVVWLAGGVVAHDFVLAPLILLLSAVVLRLVPAAVRGAVASAAIIVGTVTLMAVPVLGRFGARSDNPTLLDRHYWWGWFGFVLVVALIAGVGAFLQARRPDRPPHAEPGGDPGSPPRRARTSPGEG